MVQRAERPDVAGDHSIFDPHALQLMAVGQPVICRTVTAQNMTAG